MVGSPPFFLLQTVVVPVLQKRQGYSLLAANMQTAHVRVSRQHPCCRRKMDKVTDLLGVTACPHGGGTGAVYLFATATSWPRGHSRGRGFDWLRDR